MSRPDQSQTERPRRGSLWAYNIRILLGNTYWLIVTPLAAAQLALFWNMATATSLTAARATLTIEMLAALLGAFLCAHALAPEQDGVGELVFVRPVSVERVLLLRLTAIFAFVLVMLIPAFVVYEAKVGTFSAGLALLGSLPSMLALSALAMAVASATRQPLIGLAAAGTFWGIDLTVGGYLNPLVSLHGLSSYIEGRPLGDQWAVNKLALLGVGLLLYLWNRKTLGRPAAPRRARTIAKGVVAVVALVGCYVVGGAGYKLVYGIRHEREMGLGARMWYQQQFSGYGPLPIAPLFGPAFARYMAAGTKGGSVLGWGGATALFGSGDLSALRSLLKDYPDSIWADNAQLDVAMLTYRREAPVPWLVLSYIAGDAEPARRLIQENIEQATAEFDRLVTRYPRSPFAALALARRAEGALSLLDFGAARTAYERLLRSYPGAKEAYRAGIALSGLYLWQGRPEEARKAAVVAAAAATWDNEADALLAQAQAVQQQGRPEEARELYEAARTAAEGARRRNLENRKSPTGLSKLALFERVDAVVRVCRERLATNLAPLPGLPPGTATVTGKVVREGSGAAGLRVALGASPLPAGFPSPFLSGPAYDSVTDQRGVYRLASVAPGTYRVLAFVLKTRQRPDDWRATGVSLPVTVRSEVVEIPGAELSIVPLQMMSPARQTPIRGQTRTTRGSARRGRRGGEPGGAGSPRGTGGRRGRAEPEHHGDPGGPPGRGAHGHD
jgi:tetratricopeptide (TPR) repeat protein